MKTVSYSETSTFLRCAFAHSLSYGKGLRKLPSEVNEGNRPMHVGSVTHAFIAQALRMLHAEGVEDDDDLYQKMFDYSEAYFAENKPEPFEFTDSILGKQVDKSAVTTFRSVVADSLHLAYETVTYILAEGFSVVTLYGEPLIEYKIEYPILEDVTFVGFVDLVVERYGKVYVVDFKTRRTLDAVSEENNLQLSLYSYVLQQLGVAVGGFIIFEILSRPPNLPAILYNKNGTFKGVSRANIHTTWELYASVVESEGDNVADYQEVKEKLSHIQWRNLLYFYPNKQELEARWNNARIITQQIQAVEIPSKSQTRDCSRCQWYSLCIAHDKYGEIELDRQVDLLYNTEIDFDLGE